MSHPISQSISQSSSLYTPRHWPSWVGLGLLRLVVMLPQSARWQVARGLSRLLSPLLKRRRRITAINIGLAFPELTAQEQAQRVQAHLDSQIMGLVELGMAWWLSDRAIDKLVRIEGLEHLQSALKGKQGVILLSAHFGALDLSVRALGLKQSFDFTYRPHQNPVINHFLLKGREANDKHAIPRDDVRAFLRTLKRGRAVWYASDQNFGHKNSQFIDFFGVPAATNTGLSRIARLSGAQVVPYFYRRNADHSSYVVEILPALEHFPTDDPAQDALRVHGLIENTVSKAPEQYYWSHRRYKDRPQGETRFY